MAKSMTGYGKAEAILENGKLTIEIRTLNGKNADVNVKSPLLPRDRELAVRRKLADSLKRGTIDLYVIWEPNEAGSAKAINVELAMEYYRQIERLAGAIAAEHGNAHQPDRQAAVDGSLMDTVLRMPDVVDTRKQDIITDENWPIVESAIDRALDDINSFREREGKVLVADVSEKVSRILAISHEIEKYETERTEAIRERILSKFEELKIQCDPQRLEQEMIFYLEKLDINEERVRLRQHCSYFIETLENDPLPGRKLGFIAQEMGREINTTGSKANHTEIQKLVTSMKDELEKIKEQSLNIL